MNPEEIQFPDNKDTFSTGQVGRLLGVPASTVRYWVNTFNIPLSRKNNRRVFTRDDVITMAKIHKLRYQDNFMIKGAMDLLQNSDAAPAPAQPVQQSTYTQPPAAEAAPADLPPITDKPAAQEAIVKPADPMEAAPGIARIQAERMLDRERKYIMQELREIMKLLD